MYEEIKNSKEVHHNFNNGEMASFLFFSLCLSQIFPHEHEYLHNKEEVRHKIGVVLD